MADQSDLMDRAIVISLDKIKIRKTERKLIQDFEEAKKLLNESGLVPLDQGLANEMKASSALMGTPNQVEAAFAKLEKRAPSFRDPD